MAKNGFNAQTASATNPNYANSIGTSAAPGVGVGLGENQAGFDASQGVLGQQLTFAQMLQKQAAGQGGPTNALNYLKQGTARTNASAAGTAASNKALNPALAARQALMAQAGANQQGAGQAAATGVQEQQMAQGELGSALTGAGGTATGETGAGNALLAAAGGVGNTSNANLNTGVDAANQLNQLTAAQNTAGFNSALGGVLNGAGAAFGVWKGGEIPEGYSGGGETFHVPHMSMPRRSFAAQVAHHLKTEYFDEGGPVQPQKPPMQAAVSPKEEVADEPVRKEGDVGKKRTAETQKNETSDMDALAQDAGAKHMAKGGHVGFAAVEKSAAASGARDPAAVAAAVGRKKYGSERMAKAAHEGKPANEVHMAAGGEAPTSGEFDAPAAGESSGFFDNLGRTVGNRFNNSLLGTLLGAGRGMPETQGAPLPAGYVAPPIANAQGGPGRAFGGPINFVGGGGVPGRATVPGNSPQNDTVPAQLSPGEVVLPRTIAHDPKKARSFVEHLQGGKSPKKKKSLKEIKTGAKAA